MKRPILTMPAILLLLALLMFSPTVILGVQNERNARAAFDADYVYAAQQFELAAQRLFWRADLWNEAGDLYIYIDRVDEGLLAYENAKKNGGLGRCGWTYLGEYSDQPISIWQEGLKHYPDDALLYMESAWVYRSRGDYDLELKNLLKALLHQDAPWCDLVQKGNFADVHYRVGLLLMQDDPTRALDELNTAARLDDQYAPVVETLRTSLNLASLEDDPAEKLILIGRGLALTEEWELAASAFHDATQADPESASAWAWLGEANYQIGEDALPFFEEAESNNLNDSTLLSLRALYWQRMNDFESALADFEKLAELEPENPNWQISLGALYAELGDLPTAVAAYEKAIELETTDPIYRQLLALFSFNYGYDLAGIGVSAARRAVILAPEEARFIDTLGLVYLGLDRDEDAEHQFLRALEKNAEYAAAHLHLGMLYLKRGHRELAHTSLLRARSLAFDPTVQDQVLRLLDEYFQE